MKVLLVIPPYVPSYFNAGHHLPLFQVGTYLRRRGNTEVICQDLAALNASWRDVCDLLVQPFDAAVLLNDFDGVDGFERFVRYAREFAPSMPLATFGRASHQVPAFFDRFGFDAIACQGDYECAIETWLGHLEGTSPAYGVRVRTDQGYVQAPPAPYLEPDEWAFPDVDEIPYAAYDRLYANDLDKFCGIPGRRELVVPVARGCPVGCSFCDVPLIQGARDRRVEPDRVIDYIKAAYRQGPFEYVSFYAPTFTLRRRWVLELCAGLKHLDNIRWKCVTTTAHLDEELVTVMAESGCVRISVGVETLNAEPAEALPRVKRSQGQKVDDLLDWCASTGMELNCFLIMGLPGDTPSSVRQSIDYLISRGARVRPTILTPYDRLSAAMTTSEFASFNRQIFAADVVGRDLAAQYYEIVYANSADRPTWVSDRIPHAEFA